MWLGEPVRGVLEKPVKQVKEPKPIRKRGKRTIEYDKWRDTVAVPYLNDKFGHFCAHCSTPIDLSVDHVKNRGSSPHLKMDLNNVQWLCVTCHSYKTTHGGV